MSKEKLKKQMAREVTAILMKYESKLPLAYFSDFALAVHFEFLKDYLERDPKIRLPLYKAMQVDKYVKELDKTIESVVINRSRKTPCFSNGYKAKTLD